MSLSGVKRTSALALHMSAFDPKRTYTLDLSPTSSRRLKATQSWVEFRRRVPRECAISPLGCLGMEGIMNKLVAGTLALVCATSSAFAQSPVTAQSAPNITVDNSDLGRRLIQSRAVEAAIWGMPAVNYDLMRQAMFNTTAGKENQVIYWGRPLDWHNQTLTPNPDSIYFVAFYNTKDVGPVVLEIPPAGEDGSLNVNIVNLWQMPLADGGLYGSDKGKGGKYLLLPPGYSKKVPDGYFALRPETYGGYALLRSNLKSHSAR